MRYSEAIAKALHHIQQAEEARKEIVDIHRQIASKPRAEQAMELFAISGIEGRETRHISYAQVYAMLACALPYEGDDE